MSRFTTRTMSDHHEHDLARWFGGRVTRGSGNQFNDQMDGRNHPYTPHPFAWDGKATLAKSTSLSLATWDKAVQQADPLTPLVALRFYGSQRLDVVRDLVVLGMNDFLGLLEDARTYRQDL